jgi:hypothetical protein
MAAKGIAAVAMAGAMSVATSGRPLRTIADADGKREDPPMLPSSRISHESSHDPAGPRCGGTTFQVVAADVPAH